MSFVIAMHKLAITTGAVPDGHRAGVIMKHARMSEEDKAKARASVRFKKIKGTLDSHGVMIGAHKRVAIPKSALSETDITKHLGFTPVKIAIPEQGQKRFTSFRHMRHNYHIHDHGSHWTMHKDEHPAATMVLKRVFAKAKSSGGDAAKQGRSLGRAIASRVRLAGRVAKAVVGGVPHVITEGVPGAYYYARGRIAGAGSTLNTVISGQNKKLTRRFQRWSPSGGGQEKSATATVQDYAARAHIDTTRQLRARMPAMRPAINTARFRPPATPKPTVARALSSASSGLGGAIKGVMGAK